MRIITSGLPDRTVVDHALVEFARVAYEGAEPDETEAWILANAYRADCLVRICELVLGEGAYGVARVLLQIGSRGSLMIEYVPVGHEVDVPID